MKHRRTKVFVTILALCIAAFQISSFFGTSNAMIQMWGNPTWSYLLAFGLVAVDFGSVGRLFSDDLQHVAETENGNLMLFGAWMITAIAEALLIFLNFQSGTAQNTNHIMVTSGQIAIGTMQWTIPALMATFYWLVQTGVVISIDRMVTDQIKRMK